MEANQDLIMLVNDQDEVIGEIGKVDAHRGKGKLHRAFTVFIQNEDGKWLITKRSTQKPLWPEWWDGACSSHPWFPNESVIDAVTRRLPFEIGILSGQLGNLEDIFTYEYHAIYNDDWVEHEKNHIVVAKCKKDVSIKLNPDEVGEYRWLTAVEIDEKLATKDHRFAPWFSLAWHGLQERNLV